MFIFILRGVCNIVRCFPGHPGSLQASFLDIENLRLDACARAMRILQLNGAGVQFNLATFFRMEEIFEGMENISP